MIELQKKKMELTQHHDVLVEFIVGSRSTLPRKTCCNCDLCNIIIMLLFFKATILRFVNHKNRSTVSTQLKVKFLLNVSEYIILDT